MTEKEAIYLVEQFENRAKGRILKGEVTNIYYEAERILKGRAEIQKRGCTCEYKNMARIVSSLFDQHKDEIYRLYEQAQMDSKSGTSSTGNIQ